MPVQVVTADKLATIMQNQDSSITSNSRVVIVGPLPETLFPMQSNNGPYDSAASAYTTLTTKNLLREYITNGGQVVHIQAQNGDYISYLQHTTITVGTTTQDIVTPMLGNFETGQNPFQYYNGSTITNATFINNTAINSLQGFFIEGNNTILINNTAINSSLVGFYIGYDSPQEVYCNSTMSNNIAMNSEIGFKIYYSFNLTLLKNKALNNTVGFDIRNSFNISLKNNIVCNNYEGFYLSYSYNLNIDYNTVLNSSFSAFYLSKSPNNSLTGNIANNSITTMDTMNGLKGFSLERSNDTYLVNNTAINYSWGFHLYYSFYNTLISNIAIENKYGFELDQSSNNLLKYNVAQNNDQDFNELNSFNNDLDNNTFIQTSSIDNTETFTHPSEKSPSISQNTSISTSPFPLIGLIGAITLIIIIRRNKQNF